MTTTQFQDRAERSVFHVRVWFAGVWTKSPAMTYSEALAVEAESVRHGDRAYVEDSTRATDRR